ncbi:hypothetical protein JCM10213_003847 [Rhodosporidiobolus nylandii]
MLHALNRTHPKVRLRFFWIAGHAEVEGNEAADEMAKRGAEDSEAAAGARVRRRRGVTMPREAVEHSLASSSGRWSEYSGGETSGRKVRAQPSLAASPHASAAADSEGRVGGGEDIPKSTSGVLQAAKELLRERWTREWAGAPTGAGLRAADASPPLSAYRRALALLPRRQATLLVRLRTDFSALAAPLHRASLHPTGLCECGAKETREHFLLRCPLYAHQRATLRRSLALRQLPPASLLLSTPDFIFPLLRYINSTDRFPRFYQPVDGAAQGSREE